MPESESLAKWAAEEHSPQDLLTLNRVKMEARNAGATLSHHGKGGVDPGMALHVFRRDRWKCRICGTREDLELDHADGHPHATPANKDHGHADVASNLWTVCHSCQDWIHSKDRRIEAEEEDEGRAKVR